MAEQVWIPVLDGDDSVFGTEDLPACCQRQATEHGTFYQIECPSCGAVWERVAQFQERVWRGLLDA